MSINQKNLKFMRTLFVVLAVFIVGVYGYRAFGYSINTTHSLPVGVWKASPIAADYRLQRWQVVQFCPDSNPIFTKAIDQWENKDEFFGVAKIFGKVFGGCGNVTLQKTIGALPGDDVVIAADSITVNGQRIGSRSSKDAEGNPFPSIPLGHYKVQPNTVWLLSVYNEKSFDSRYFGAVNVDQLKSIMRPISIDESKRFCYLSDEYVTHCVGVAKT